MKITETILTPACSDASGPIVRQIIRWHAYRVNVGRQIERCFNHYDGNIVKHCLSIEIRMCNYTAYTAVLMRHRFSFHSESRIVFPDANF